MTIIKIKEFYSECNVLITGGTGFMGKVLIEKLLRSCPGITNIYVLMRQRKDKCIFTRVKEMLMLPLFEKVTTQNPDIGEKIIPVLSDLSEIRLGLSDDDYNMLIKKISIVFHAAATVRFDEPLNSAIIKNVRGTLEVVQLSKQMMNLKVFLHVSTTYCNLNRIYVEEKVYEAPFSWRDAIYIAENLDSKLSEICTSKFLGSFPNTYTFTKLLAEQIINEEVTKSINPMPMVIFRPSIVISTLEEPVAGWIDNLNGPISLMIASGKGLALVTLADKEKTADFMCVDLSIKAMIVAAYHRGTHNTMLDDKLPIYNGSSVDKSITNDQLLQYGVKYFMLHPFDEILWRPRLLVTSSKLIFYILTILQQVLPAIMITFVMKATGKPQKINLVKLQQKIYLATIALSSFTTRTWIFVNTNFLGLLKHITDDEKEDFDFKFDHVNAGNVFKSAIVGAQKYLFNTNFENREEALKKLNRLVWIDRILRTIFFALIALYILKLSSNILSTAFINKIIMYVKNLL